MKNLLCALLLMIFLPAAAQNSTTYNAALADSLGADEYGMKTYVLAILKTGSNTTADQQKTSEAFAGHMANIGRLAEEGKLVVAGPFFKNDKQYRGIYIFNVTTIAEAEELLITDPAIKEKLLEAELFRWYGSAALPIYLETHKQIEKNKP
ncbi:MAG: hypothetical protein ITG00_08075 [Flavobacterium sp.]|nr:hypothetical protein [Flavobacterium sp.]